MVIDDKQRRKGKEEENRDKTEFARQAEVVLTRKFSPLLFGLFLLG